MPSNLLKIEKDKFLIFLFRISFFILIFGIILFISNTNKGFDFTDEGYYFNSLEGDFYKYSFSNFSEVLRPLYLLLNKNIILLRISNIFISISLGYWLISQVYSILKLSDFLFDNRNVRKMFFLSISSISLLEILQIKIYTPSYNNLCFYGVSIASIALIRIYNSEKKQFLNFVLLSLSILLLFLAKLPSALVLSFSILLASIILKKKFKFHFLSILFGIFVSVLFISNFYEIQIINLFDTYKYNYNILQMLGSSHGVSFIFQDTYFLIKDFFSNIHLVLYWVLFYFNIIFYNNSNFKRLRITTWISNFYLISPLITLYLFKDNIIFLISFYFAFPISILITYLITNKHKIKKNKFILFVIIFLMPYFYSIGTNNSYIYTLCRVPIFFVISGIIIASDLINNMPKIIINKFERLIIIFSILSTIIFFNFLSEFNLYPYRQQTNLFDYSKSFFIRGNTEIKISDSAFKYLKDSNNIINKNNFENNQLVLDLTGRSPGFIYAIGGKPLFAPWILGGYQGSNKVLGYFLDKAELEDLKNAWILTEPNTYQSLNENLLIEKGIDLYNEKKYKLVFKVDSSKINPYFGHESFQYFYKPIKN